MEFTTIRDLDTMNRTIFCCSGKGLHPAPVHLFWRPVWKKGLRIQSPTSFTLPRRMWTSMWFCRSLYQRRYFVVQIYPRPRATGSSMSMRRCSNPRAREYCNHDSFGLLLKRIRRYRMIRIDESARLFGQLVLMSPSKTREIGKEKLRNRLVTCITYSAKRSASSCQQS